MAKRASMLRSHINEIVNRSARIAVKEFNLDDYEERRSLRDFIFHLGDQRKTCGLLFLESNKHRAKPLQMRRTSSNMRRFETFGVTAALGGLGGGF